MAKPCRGCDEEESHIYRDGKVKLRFIRANKKPKGAMRNYNDGETYWMHPRHAALPWWEYAERIRLPIVEPATEADSVFEAVRIDDIETDATVGPSGMTLQPSGRVTGGFREPEQIVVNEPEAVPPQLEAPVEEPKPSPADVGFPTDSSPSARWTKKELLAFIKHKDGVAKLSMKKEWLLQIASSLQ